MDSPVVSSPAALLLRTVEATAAELAARIVVEDRAYTESGAITESELRDACRDNLAEIIGALAGRQPTMASAQAVGRLKAERGIPVAALLHAFRLGGRLLWEQLTTRSAGPGDPDLHRLATRLWDLIDAYSDAAVEAYRDTETLLAHSDAQVRYRLVRTLFDDHADAPVRPLTAMRTLGIPEDGTFLVAVVGPNDAGSILPGRLVEALRDAGAATVWDSQVDVHVGLLRATSAREMDRAVTRLGELVDGRVGLSALFENPAGIPAALAQGRLAARSLPAGVDRMIRYGDDPVAHLLATVPEAGSVMAGQILDPVLVQPDGDREDLLAVLTAWYACGGSASGVAERLHCHRNTVRYRLRKVRDLTGRDVSDPVQSAELFLALRGADLLGMTR